MQRFTSSSRLFRDDFKALFRAYKGQMLRITVLSGFLLFLLNILIGISFYGNAINGTVKDKLGMYFYLKDVPAEQEAQQYKQVLTLIETLQSEGLQVTFSTREDALAFLQKRLPDLTGSFQKFGMKNPLPATLYVIFRNQSQYETLQRVLNEHKELILNLQDFSQLDSLQQQESRVVNIIKLSNVIQVVCYALVIVLVAVILSFAVFFLRGIFSTFRKDIQVKKLLGATKSQIIQPFMMIIMDAMLGGFLMAIILAGGSMALCDTYMFQVFNFSLLAFLGAQWMMVVAVLVGEIVLILGLVWMISYHFVATLHKKLR